MASIIKANINLNDIKKKFVKGRKGSLGQWCVTYYEFKDKRIVEHRNWFVKESKCDEFIKNKKDEISTKTT